jgi:hypothetical protein
MKLTFCVSQTILVTGIAIAVSGWSNSALALQPQAEISKPLLIGVSISKVDSRR